MTFLNLQLLIPKVFRTTSGVDTFYDTSLRGMPNACIPLSDSQYQYIAFPITDLSGETVIVWYSRTCQGALSRGGGSLEGCHLRLYSSFQV